MHILIVDYIKPAESVEPHIPPHGAWVKKYIDQGIFLFAGPKKSKLGGVILAKSIDRKQLLAIIAEDPYVSQDVAEYRIVDFDAKITIAELDYLKDQ